MKIFIKRLLVIIYIISSMGILMTAIAYPFALSLNDAPPLWSCWVLYPITLIIIVSQKQVLKWARIKRR